MGNKITLSSLGHTWIFDLDGTVVKHNGYKIDGHDTLLPGAKEFFMSLPENDVVIFVTSRERRYKEMTESFLDENNIPYRIVIYGMPYGERILINDAKPSGLKMSVAINTIRDQFADIYVAINEKL